MAGIWRDLSALRNAQCPFLGDPSSDCLALDDPLPLSDRQRELVCLRPIHETCPRYLRATTAGGASSLMGEGATARRSLLWPVAGVLLCVVIVVGGLLWLGPSLAGLLPAAGSPTATVPQTSATSDTPLPTASPRPTPTLATATPRPTPTPSPTHSSSWPPGATQSRMSLLKPCTDTTSCYLYTVKSGETLSAIAKFFGVSIDAIMAMNPAIPSPDRIDAGQTIRIPPPTR